MKIGKYMLENQKGKEAMPPEEFHSLPMVFHVEYN